jgi:hypothetical protein
MTVTTTLGSRHHLGRQLPRLLGWVEHHRWRPLHRHLRLRLAAAATLLLYCLDGGFCRCRFRRRLPRPPPNGPRRRRLPPLLLWVRQPLQRLGCNGWLRRWYSVLLLLLLLLLLFLSITATRHLQPWARRQALLRRRWKPRSR